MGSVLGTEFIKLLRLLGLPLAAASALTVLLLESRPLSLSELSKKTGYAKSHLSNAIRLLEEKLLIERIVLPKKKVLFKAEKRALIKLLRNHLAELRSSLQNVIDNVKARDILTHEVHLLEKSLYELIKMLGGGNVYEEQLASEQ